MYSVYDYEKLISQSFMPYLHACRDCKVEHLCSRDKDGRLPCGWGRLLSFVYSKYKVPFYDLPDKDIKSSVRCDAGLIELFFTKTKEHVFLLNGLYTKEYFIWMFEDMVDSFDFNSGIAVAYSTLDNVYELSKDKAEGSYHAMQGLINCDCLFLDEVYVDEKNTYNKKLLDWLNYRKSQKCGTVFRIKNENNNMLKTIKYFGLEGAIII